MAEVTAPPARAPGPRRRRQEFLAGEKKFHERLDRLGIISLDSYGGNKAPHRIVCPVGHSTTVRGDRVADETREVCKTCAKEIRVGTPRSTRSSLSLRSEAKYMARLAEEGAIPLEPWKGSKFQHRVKCQASHVVSPKADRVIQGGGICRVCSKQDPETAWLSFRARVAELGGVVLEETWLGTGKRHKARCWKGHICYPFPGRVSQSVGICRTCAGRDPVEAERQFRTRLAGEGVVLLDRYGGANVRARFRCASGHEFDGLPSHMVRSGATLCQVCGGRDPESRLADFAALVEAQDGTLLESRWLGAHEKHDCMCAQGHLCSPRPAGVASGKSICRICACRDPHVVEERFRERVTELGGDVLGGWRTIHVPVLVRCARGHETSPVPNHVIQGGGLCRFCKGKAWDAFYVVQDDVNDVVKFGITSGNGRIRLALHRRGGLDRVVRLCTGLPGTDAPDLERAVLGALRDAREEPVRGREYFPVRVLPVILHLVDHHPAVRRR